MIYNFNIKKLVEHLQIGDRSLKKGQANIRSSVTADVVDISQFRFFVNINMSVNNQQMKRETKLAACAMLYGMLLDGTLPHGALKKTADCFSVDRSAVSLLWKKFRETALSIHKKIDNVNGGNEETESYEQTINFFIDFTHPELQEVFDTKTHMRRQGKYNYEREELLEKLKELPLKDRRTYRHVRCWKSLRMQ